MALFLLPPRNDLLAGLRAYVGGVVGAAAGAIRADHVDDIPTFARPQRNGARHRELGVVGVGSDDKRNIARCLVTHIQPAFSC